MSTDADIVAFIRARLDEVEARVHNDIGWWFDDCAISATNREGIDITGADDYIRPFIDPARWRRGVEVKRRLIQAASSWVHDEPDGTLTLAMAQECWRKALALLASEWDTHPDFRPEWTL